MKKRYSILFWIVEAALLIAAGFLAFMVVGYLMYALICVGLAALLGLYRLIYHYSMKKPKRAKTLKIALTSLVLIALAAFIAIEIPIISSSYTDKDPEAEYIIVLGAGVNGTVPSLSLYERLRAAKDYLDLYPDAKAVVSGGQGPGEDITEAECMRRWLEKNGIAPERILMEEESTSTYENLKNSLDIIIADGGDADGRIAIVSSEYHLYRAKYMATQLGAQPLGVAAKTALTFLRANYYIREALAVAALWIM